MVVQMTFNKLFKIIAVFLMMFSALFLAKPSFAEGKSKAIVVYFSMPDNVDDSTVTIEGQTLGNTEYVAKTIASLTGADSFRIENEKAYPTDHKQLVKLAADEKLKQIRPKLKGHIDNFKEYDTVYLGYPIWWVDMPMILYSFIEEYDFTNKKVYPFVTHGGSGLADTIDTLKAKLPKAKIYEDALCIDRDDVDESFEDIKAWVLKVTK